MSYLYVNDNGVTVGVEANRCVAKYPDGMVKYVPIESLEGIVIMGQSQLTTRCTEECLKREINISYFSIFWKVTVNRTCQGRTTAPAVFIV